MTGGNFRGFQQRREFANFQYQGLVELGNGEDGLSHQPAEDCQIDGFLRNQATGIRIEAIRDERILIF
jgi:hypothetical protein